MIELAFIGRPFQPFSTPSLCAAYRFVYQGWRPWKYVRTPGSHWTHKAASGDRFFWSEVDD